MKSKTHTKRKGRWLLPEARCSAALQRRALKSISKNITRNTHAIAEELALSLRHASSILYTMRKKGIIIRVTKGLSGPRGYPPLWMLPNPKSKTYWPGMKRASDKQKEKLIREIVVGESPNDRA